MIERTPLETLAFAAWVNCDPKAIPPEYKQHICEATMVAWKRVALAIQGENAVRIIELEAERDALAARVKALEAATVKPLVWEGDNWKSRIRAKTSIGDYVLWWGYGGEKHSLRYRDEALTEYTTLEAAKAAAQADYDARILSALTSKDDAVAAKEECGE